MNILITAGNTQTPIDRVRCITNIFSGRTGAIIAAHADACGHQVTLITSHPEALTEISTSSRMRILSYRTFEELQSAIETGLNETKFDVVVHAAAVNDYHVVGTFARIDGEFVDVSAAKIKGHHPDLWLRLTPAPKLIDRYRKEWGYRGILVKFKLEVDVSDQELVSIAEASRAHSGADLMVANTLEGMREWAYVGAGSSYAKIPRADLAARLIAAIERSV